MVTTISVVETLTGDVLRQSVPLSDYSWKSSLTMPGDATFMLEGYAVDEQTGEDIWSPQLFDDVSGGWAPTWVIRVR